MKRFLLITMAFPPKGAVGALRTYRLCKYLPALGWRPEVLTTHPWGTVNQRDTLLDEIRDTVTIHRTKLIDPVLAWQRRSAAGGVSPASGTAEGSTAKAQPRDRAAGAGKLKRMLLGLVSTPDHMVFWNIHLLIEGIRILRQRKDIRFILTSTPPHSSLLGGTMLSRLFGLPHVLDLRDPWGGRPGLGQGAFRSRLEGALEKWVVRRASRVISSTPGYNRVTRERFPRCEPRRFVSITNCFEPEKFQRIAASPSKKFTLCYLGIFYPANNPYPFFPALRQWLESNPAVRPELELVLVGSGDPQTLRAVGESGLEDIVTVTGRLPHEEAMGRAKSADLLLLLMGLNETVHPAWVPAKLYEYLACHKPILAFGPPGEALSMIERVGMGHPVTSEDPAGFIEVLDRQYRVWREQGPDAAAGSGNPAELEKLTSAYTSRQFADLFDAVDQEHTG